MYKLLLQFALILIFLGIVMPEAHAGCRTDIPATPSGRFVDNGNGTITDTATNLTWMKCAEGLSGTDCLVGTPLQLTWQGALQWAEGAGFGWQLPNKNELVSLVDWRCSSPAINTTLFPNTPYSDSNNGTGNGSNGQDYFWTSSPYTALAGSAWGVWFYDGFSTSAGKDQVHYVRLVRDGMGAPLHQVTSTVSGDSAGQSISPNIRVVVSTGTTTFTVTLAGTTASVSGCGATTPTVFNTDGSHIYYTVPILGDCTVNADFTIK